MSKWKLSTIVICLALLTASLTGNIGAADPIKIAVIGPMTGTQQQHGIAYKYATQIALSEYNAAGGYKGREIVATFYDDKSDANEGANIAHLVVGTPGIVAAIGTFSSTVSLAMAPIFSAAKIPLYTPSSTHVDLTRLNEFAIRHHPTTSMLQVHRANWMFNEMKLTKAAFVYMNDDSGVSANALFRDEYTKLGGKVVVSEGYNPGNKDFSAIVTKIKASGADNLHLNAPASDSATIIRQAREQNVNIIVTVSTTAMTSELLSLLGEYAEGVLVVAPFDPTSSNPNIQALVKKYAAVSNGALLPTHGYMCYEVWRHIFSALEAVGPDSVKMTTFMRNNKNFNGSNGIVQFTNGDANVPLFRIVVKGGKFVSFN